MSNSEVVEKNEQLPKYRIRPKNYANIDRKNEKLEYEIHLPGVDKKKISLKILPDLWVLEAERIMEDSIIIYSLTKYFPYLINVNSTDAKYENGLLKFSVKLKDPLEDAVDIKLS